MKRDSFDLKGRTALITGAGGLLGVQHAGALLQRGAHVVLTDINLESLERARDVLVGDFGHELISVEHLDVRALQSISDLFRKLLGNGTEIRILINNAAIDAKVSAGTVGREMTRFENFTIDQWQLELDVGLRGAFLCSQVFGSWMAENGGGVILNIASDLSVIAPDQRLYRRPGLAENQQPAKPVTYSVVKAGLVGLTRYLAAYWAAQGVRVNALSPGGVYNQQSEDFILRLTNLIPMGRMASADEYASAVQFLCSDASSYMTGQNLVMDGGRSIL
jgi:NAD(P)-dependent dehydrogenase (short-subunit alcohol dehydrogenase family)